jgi:hypothetical protein
MNGISFLIQFSCLCTYNCFSSISIIDTRYDRLRPQHRVCLKFKKCEMFC